MATNIGPHLLGRIPNEPDERDYKMSLAFGDRHSMLAPTGADPLLQMNERVQKSGTSLAAKAWISEVTKRLAGSPAPVPPVPTPDVKPVSWKDNEPVLDQGSTGHCVGFGWAQWGNTLPYDDKFKNTDGDAIYYECKVIDGEPLQEDGSQVRSGAKALKARGRLDTYVFADTIDEAIAWIMTKGPVVMGTDWTEDMFTPDKNGLVKPTGQVAGGHCYVAVGYDPKTQLIEYINSWDDSWGVDGHFFMSKTNAASLHAAQGDACGALELK